MSQEDFRTLVFNDLEGMVIQRAEKKALRLLDLYIEITNALLRNGDTIEGDAGIQWNASSLRKNILLKMHHEVFAYGSKRVRVIRDVITQVGVGLQAEAGSQIPDRTVLLNAFNTYFEYIKLLICYGENPSETEHLILNRAYELIFYEPAPKWLLEFKKISFPTIVCFQPGVTPTQLILPEMEYTDIPDLEASPEPIEVEIIEPQEEKKQE